MNSACRSVRLSALAGVVVLAPLAAAVAADWPWFRGPDRNSISTESAWAPEKIATPKILWKVNVGKGYSSFAIVGNRLYTMGNLDDTDKVSCLDVKNGSEVWTHTYPCKGGNFTGCRSTPTVENGKVYTVGREGQVFCLDAATGRPVWEKNVVKDGGAKIPEWGIASSAVIDGNLLYVNAGAGGIALDKATGREVWNGGSGAAGYSSPVVFKTGAGKFVALFAAKELVVADAATGRKKAAYPWQTSYDVNGADPLVIGDRIFISSGYDRGCTMLKFTGSALEKVWENKNIRSHFTSPVFLDGVLYGVDGQAGGKAQLTCLDPATGSVKWRGETGFGGMMVASGKILVLNDRGFLVAAEANPAGYKEIARGKVVDGKPWTMPVLANGVVYCRNEKGDLVAVDVSK